ncbi:MAG: hypothetical protein IPJ20_08350 [Flammeovirgaceae bacterium]|nr:hypothetical protein [Flammeovirgaceae bacterium]
MANYSFGIDYDFNAKNYLTSSIRLGGRGSTNYQDQLTTNTLINNILTNQIIQNVVSDNNAKTIDVNVNYTHLYKKKDRELSFLAMYSINDGINNFESLTLDSLDFSPKAGLKMIMTVITKSLPCRLIIKLLYQINN